MSQEKDPNFAVDWFSDRIQVWDNYKPLFFNKPNMRCLEIGSFEGRSTIYTAENYCNGKGSYVDALDTWKGSVEHENTLKKGLYNTFISNLQYHIDDQRVHVHRGYSSDSLMKIVPEVRAGTKDKYDFIYIDGSHIAKDVLLDATLAWEVLNINGVMIFDDYNWFIYSHPAMIPKYAIDGFLESYSCMYKVLYTGYQMHIMKISDNPEAAKEDCPSKLNSLLYDYADMQNMDEVNKVLVQGAKVDQVHPIGSTTLYMAAQEGRFEVAKALLEFGADPEIKSKNGASPLYISVGNNDGRMVELLLDYNASTATTNGAGYTPLHAAAHHGYDNILQLLLAKEANKLVEVNGNTPFKMALNMDHLSSAKILAGGEEEFCQELQGTGFEVKYAEICGEVAVEL